MSPAKEAQCPAQDALVAFSVGKAPQETMTAISAHLETCQDCLSALAALPEPHDSLLRGLRASLSGEQFLGEPECQQAVARFEAIGCDPSMHGQTEVVPRPAMTELGRYRILKELGRGGMGTVYLALDTQLDRQVALKIPHFRPSDRPRLLERFYREARAAAMIDHPNLCPIYDVGEIDGVPYLSMAFIPGRSLAKVIKAAGRLAERPAAEIVRKLALAVAEAHRRGIVHRDIKPSNVMMAEKGDWLRGPVDAAQPDASPPRCLSPSSLEGEPILMDFGLARRLETADARLTRHGQLVGTPAYMAPEQVQGGPEAVGPSCDIYSLGVVLYELLTGKVPFEGPLLSVLSQVGKDQPAPPSAHRPDLDRRLEAICLKALAKNPAERYESAEELAEALEAYLQGPPQKAAAPSRKRRWPWLAAVPLLVAAAVIIYLKTDSGTLIVEVHPADTHVTIDGSHVQIKSPRDEISLAVGEHDLEVRKDGFHTHTDSFTIRRGGKVEVTVLLERAAVPGKLLLTLHSATPTPDDRFGFVVAPIEKNILVGSCFDHRGGNAGAAYLFDGTTGKLLQVLDNPTPAAGDEFGVSVAGMGTKVLIAARYDDTAGPESGAAYLFDVGTGRLLHTFLSPAPIGRDWLGYTRTAVAGFGDDVLVGACQHYSGAGVVYLFDGKTGKLKLTFRNPAPRRSDSFGLSVAVLGKNVLVGAPWAVADPWLDVGPPQSGAVYLFDGATGKHLRTFAKPKGADEFGYCVAAVAGNVLVGAPRDETSGVKNSGAAYLFDGSSGKLLHTFRDPTPAPDEELGVCVAALGDDVLVGNDGGRPVFLFDGTTGKLLEIFEDPSRNPGSKFGSAVAALGRNVLVGAYFDDTYGHNAGIVYLFAGPEKREAKPSAQHPTDKHTE